MFNLCEEVNRQILSRGFQPCLLCEMAEELKRHCDTQICHELVEGGTDNTLFKVL